MERRVTQLDEGGEKRHKKSRDLLIAFPEILVTQGGHVKRQAGPKKGG